jgi:hypothetical protein
MLFDESADSNARPPVRRVDVRTKRRQQFTDLLASDVSEKIFLAVVIVEEGWIAETGFDRYFAQGDLVELASFYEAEQRIAEQSPRT